MKLAPRGRRGEEASISVLPQGVARQTGRKALRRGHSRAWQALVALPNAYSAMIPTRRPLRADVHAELVSRVIRGDLAAGTSINENVLAQSLGVSRTPIREALLQLEDEGLCAFAPGKGWSVTSLTVQTVHDVYPIISALEVVGLRSSDSDRLAELVPELESLNSKIAAAANNAKKAQGADDLWHECLLSICNNERLLPIIRRHKRIVHRYEYFYMHDVNSVPMSVYEHAAIADALRRGQRDHAVALLEENWRTGMEALSNWLKQREG